MALPRSVEAAEKAADEMISRNAQGGQEAAPEGEAPQADEGQPAQEPEAQREQPQQEPEQEDWKAKYEKLQQQHRVLQGKYSAEVPRMAGEIRKLKQEISSLQEAAKAAPQEGGTDDADGPDPEAFSEYGDEFKQLAQYARQAHKENQDLKAKLSQIEQNLGTVTEQSQQASEQTFYQNLSSLCEDWEELNYNQDFIQWLQGPNPYTGQPRQESLNDAVNQGDAARTAGIFNEFKRLNGSAQPQEKPQQRKMPNQQPPKKRSADAPADDNETYYTRSQVKKLYDDYRRGAYAGREEEWKKIEQDIFKAQGDGRIRQG